METRSASRELALLALFQLPKNPEKLAKTDLQAIVLAAVRTLADHAKQNAKNAEAYFIQTERYLLNYKSEHPSNESEVHKLNPVQIPDTDEFARHLDNCYQAISYIREAVTIPELYWHYNNSDVQEFTLSLISNFINNKDEVNSLIEETTKTWDMTRIRKIEKGILRIAVAEMVTTSSPKAVIVSEAIKLGNKYSTEDGVKFINGVLGDISESLTSLH